MIRLIGFLIAAAPAVAFAAEADPAAGEHPAGAHELPPLLTLDGGMAVWTLVLFIFLLIVLGKFVWPHILQGLDARERKIRGDIEGAEQANKAAKATLEEYRQKLTDAHAEARKLIDETRRTADQLRSKLKADTEQELVDLRKRATAEIAQAKHQAVEDLYATAAQLSVAVAEKILQRQITETDTQQLVSQSLSELTKLSDAG